MRGKNIFSLDLEEKKINFFLSLVVDFFLCLEECNSNLVMKIRVHFDFIKIQNNSVLML